MDGGEFFEAIKLLHYARREVSGMLYRVAVVRVYASVGARYIALRATNDEQIWIRSKPAYSQDGILFVISTTEIPEASGSKGLRIIPLTMRISVRIVIEVRVRPRKLLVQIYQHTLSSYRSEENVFFAGMELELTRSVAL